ncbi:Up in starvation, partial [Spiromyces aspiralis]
MFSIASLASATAAGFAPTGVTTTRPTSPSPSPSAAYSGSDATGFSKLNCLAQAAAEFSSSTPAFRDLYGSDTAAVTAGALRRDSAIGSDLRSFKPPLGPRLSSSAHQSRQRQQEQQERATAESTAEAVTTATTSRGRIFRCTIQGCGMVFTRCEHLARHASRIFSRFDNMIQHTQTHNRSGRHQPLVSAITNCGVNANGRGRTRRANFRPVSDPSNSHNLRRIRSTLGEKLAECCLMPTSNPLYSSLTLRPLLTSNLPSFPADYEGSGGGDNGSDHDGKPQSGKQRHQRRRQSLAGPLPGLGARGGANNPERRNSGPSVLVQGHAQGSRSGGRAGRLRKDSGFDNSMSATAADSEKGGKVTVGHQHQQQHQQQQQQHSPLQEQRRH